MDAIRSDEVGCTIEIAVSIGPLEEPVVSAFTAFVGGEQVLLAFEEIILNTSFLSEPMLLVIIKLPGIITLRLIPRKEESSDPAESAFLKCTRIPVKVLKLKLTPAMLLPMTSLPIVKAVIAVCHDTFAMWFPINVISNIGPLFGF